MIRRFIPLVVLWVLSLPLACSTVFAQAEKLPGLTAALQIEPEFLRPKSDWLINDASFKARVYRSEDAKEIVLCNGLIRRAWRFSPNCACVAFEDLVNNRSLIRAVSPEAEITIDGKLFKVGGLHGQPNRAFLKESWVDNLGSNPDDFRFVHFEIGPIEDRFGWKRVRHIPDGLSWPPKGIQLRMDYVLPKLESAESFERDSSQSNVRVSVFYVMYDGIPCVSKWVTCENTSQKEVISIDRLTTETLALVEHTNWVEKRPGVEMPRSEQLHVETDFAFGGFSHQNSSRHVVHWRDDPAYETQVNYLKQTPCLLVVSPTVGPAQRVAPKSMFESYRTFELVYDSTERERRGLALRKMYRTIAPWTTENPLMMHLRVSDEASVRKGIDQCADVGFEMLILSFGSGFNIEDRSEANVEKWRRLAEYAHEKNVEIGGYSLLASRSVGGGNDVVSPKGQKPTFGNAPALTSEWGRDYFSNLKSFYQKTGFNMLEHDGSYPGDIDVTPRPPYQQGELDSRWAQWRIISDWYKWCRSQGIYLNVPDYYYLAGSSKCGMGYRETNWSLPRAQQVLHTRQNIFDGTWTKTPSMGWMFVPLSQYHGGGAAATIEPLAEHLDHYRIMMQSNFALGVQACYRGPRLFDTDETREMVRTQVDWFKKYRDILESDVIHGRRADGRDLDWMLHVNPKLKNRGFLAVFNPTNEAIRKSIRVNLYYTGISDLALSTDQGGAQQLFKLNRDFTIDVEIEVQPHSMTWRTFESRD